MGLNHGLALRPREEEILPAIEGLFYRLKESNVIKKNYMATERVKYALRSFAYNILDLEDKQFYQDSKRTKIIKNLRKKVVILKPDKGQGIVLIKKEDYITSMEQIFADKSKFKVVDTDNTISRVENLKRYLNTMLNRGEITEEEKKEMRKKGANRARARGLPKTHKSYDRIPPFRPIVDTTNTPYSGIGSFLKKLLYPLTLNEYSMKDSFQTVEELGKIDYSLLQKGYKLVSFDVVSIFTNVPLKRTINIIVNRIYNDKLIETKIRKHTLKKLILDCCTKTTFSFNDKLYDQIDGVCMGSALGPVLANIIMTELERLVMPKLFEDGTVKFYARYVDDTIVMIKEDKVDSVLQEFNKFDRNLKFTVDTFDDGHVHFLDLTIDTSNGEIDVYSKPTNTGQYSHYRSFSPWNYKVAWARALFNRAKRICSTPTLFRAQKTKIGKILSWNGFPTFCRKKLLRGFAEDWVKKNSPTNGAAEEPSSWAGSSGSWIGTGRSSRVNNNSPTNRAVEEPSSWAGSNGSWIGTGRSSRVNKNSPINRTATEHRYWAGAVGSWIESGKESAEEVKELPTFTLKIPYVGNTGDRLVKNLKRKIRQNVSEEIRLRVLFTTSKIAKFCSVKDRIPDAQKNGIIYSIKCPGCGETYVGKTECCFDKRLEEHAKLVHQPMNQHFSKCAAFQHVLGIHQLPDANDGAIPTRTKRRYGAKTTSQDELDTQISDFYLETLRNNSKVLTTSNDWLVLAYLEPLLAKRHNAKINEGEKAMRTLNLF